MSRSIKTNTDQREHGIPASITLKVGASIIVVSEPDLKTLAQPINYKISSGLDCKLFPTSVLYSLYQAKFRIGNPGFVSSEEVSIKASKGGQVDAKKLEAVHSALGVLSQLEQPLAQVLEPGTQQTQKWAITLKGREVVRAIISNTEGIRLMALEQGDLTFRSLLKALGGVEIGQASLLPTPDSEALRKRVQA